jgi:hypothetical protein
MKKVAFENDDKIFSKVLSCFEKRYCVDLFIWFCALIVILECSKEHYAYTSFSKVVTPRPSTNPKQGLGCCPIQRTRGLHNEKI